MRKTFSLAGDRPTLFGLGAVGFWSTLAIFTTWSGKIPPFQLTAMTFALGATIILGIAAVQGRLHAAIPAPAALALGIFGLFGDSVLYFAALKLSPPAEANLIHYLWPLLIVIFASFLPGGSLTPRHLFGAGLGLVAVTLLVGGKLGGGDFAKNWPGYALALAGACVWASYSVLSRLVKDSPTETIGAVLALCAVLATGAHLALETTHWPPSPMEWLGVVGLGIGSMGLAFLFWDIGMKRGDIAFLGVASYAAPVISTLILVAAGQAQLSLALAGACALIVAGALIARKA